MQGTSGSHYLPPPPDAISDQGGQPLPVQQNWNIPSISEGEAREAFFEYASSHGCCSGNLVKEMVYKDIQSFNAYRYRLETFTESRFFEWKSKPFSGTFPIPTTDVTALLPWAVPVAIPKMFSNDTKEIIIPSTSSVKECSVCKSQRTIACTECGGCTKEKCHWCNGTGLFIQDTCSKCSGTGLSDTRCRTCSGHGKINCNECSGQGFLLVYNALVVKWENNIAENMSYQRNEFPAKQFQEVTGQKLFVDEQIMVHPITNFPDSSINYFSSDAIGKHQAQFISTSRILRQEQEALCDPRILITRVSCWHMSDHGSNGSDGDDKDGDYKESSSQRQTIEQILLTRVEYTWRDKPHSFYVYGNEHKVYTEDYPQTCCCTIM